MAELLTNNPEAMKSISGLTPEIPCSGLGNNWTYYLGLGVIGRVMPCSYNNFNDWLNTLQSRFRILQRNYAQIKSHAEAHFDKPLTPNEQDLEGNIKEIQDVVMYLRETPPGLHRNDYYKKIAEIQSALADTNALLEFAQEQNEERRGDGKYITAGLQRPSENSGLGMAVLALGLGVGGWYLIKYLKKKE